MDPLNSDPEAGGAPARDSIYSAAADATPPPTATTRSVPPEEPHAPPSPTSHEYGTFRTKKRGEREDTNGNGRQQRPERPVTVTPQCGDDAARSALLVSATKADNLRRFRMLFVGLLVSISSSTQGLHSVFGVLYLQQALHFNVRQMTVIYLAGTALGMFTFPFAVLYDWFGPRLPIAVASAIGAVGHLLFALMFGGHITTSVAHCAIFYAIMCWGCYGLLVVIVPSVPTHMPRDRGVPTGLLTSVATLGALLLACLFRGFFEGNYSNLMWFLFAVVVAAGIAGTWYLEDAPYVVNRWRRRRITPRQQLRAFLIRNRYMSQLVPQLRYECVTMLLTLINMYMLVQAVCIGYLAADITPGKMRGIAIGAIVLFLLILILVVPVNAIDGLSEQDKEVIAAAREKEAALRAMQEQGQGAGDAARVSNEAVGLQQGDDAHSRAVTPLAGRTPRRVAGKPATSSNKAGGADCARDAAEQSAATRSPSGPTAVNPREGELGSLPASPMSLNSHSPLCRLPDGHGRAEPPGALRFPLFEQAQPAPPLIAVDVASTTRGGLGSESSMPRVARAPSFSSHQLERTFRCVEHAEVFTGGAVTDGENPCPPPATSSPPPPAFIVRVNSKLERNKPPSATRVQAINVCDEVYVLPVYQTTFLRSLRKPDTWLMFYTTLCVWGVGYTMTGNWNIQVMLAARFAGMTNKEYVLVSSFSAMAIVSGRLFVGTYERVLKVLREGTGVTIVPTLIYPVASLGLLLGMILWIALPGNLGLLAAYIVSSFFFGLNTCGTVYVISTIFDRDIGMHYGFCYLGGGIGFVLCYWCSWYLTYSHEATSGGCIGERRCMNRAVGIYLCLVFSSIFAAAAVHIRYWGLVHREVEFHQVIAAPQHFFGSWFCFRARGGRPSGESHEEEATQ